MSITLKTWQNQTVKPDELARALWDGDPQSVAWTLFYLFDIAHKTSTSKDDREAKLDAVAAACVERGLLPHVQDLAHRIARHKHKKETGV